MNIKGKIYFKTINDKFCPVLVIEVTSDEVKYIYGRFINLEEFTIHADCHISSMSNKDFFSRYKPYCTPSKAAESAKITKL